MDSPSKNAQLSFSFSYDAQTPDFNDVQNSLCSASQPDGFPSKVFNIGETMSPPKTSELPNCSILSKKSTLPRPFALLNEESKLTPEKKCKGAPRSMSSTPMHVERPIERQPQPHPGAFLYSRSPSMQYTPPKRPQLESYGVFGSSKSDYPSLCKQTVEVFVSERQKEFKRGDYSFLTRYHGRFFEEVIQDQNTLFSSCRLFTKGPFTVIAEFPGRQGSIQLKVYNKI